ncbi:M-phase inducer phosphatase 1-B-like isoform X2 [Mixophyes fleayi]|uniref:M-phase inducer phosphatase 1-B-like isoform X2 n=1 Tax=Mixophyes fleayi TaxID=3061075 RepID=UPI003F4E40D9
MSYTIGDRNLLEMDILQNISNTSEPGSSDSSLDEVLTFSPDLGLSPVTDLSGDIGLLRCTGSVTPRRRLKLSPDSQNPSPTETPSLLQPAMGTADLSVFPSESTPQRSNASDSSFESIIYKPKIAGRRDNDENGHYPDRRKKTSRMKLLDLFHSPELVTEQRPQRPERAKHGHDRQRSGNRTENKDCCENKRFSMCDLSPTLKDADNEDDDLIGDFSKPYCLPVEKGKHQDLKYIRSHTLAHLLSGGYKDIVQTYHIVDCRYPYEYAGGRIKGAWNVHREEQISEYFLKDPGLSQCRRVLIFHCEFSSERAPKLCRLLRNLDRQANIYPHLYYPELYLLKGGYKEFYGKFKILCEPQGYVSMLHRDFGDQLKKYRKKKKPLSGQRIRKELFKR